MTINAFFSFLGKRMFPGCLIVCFTAVSGYTAEKTTVSHAIAINGQPKYAAGFRHPDYVNPEAPKGGTLRRARIGSYDSFNPFITKGSPAAGLTMIYDQLMVESADESFTQYGLIASRIEYPADRSWVVFHLDPRARFHDGKPITAEDVVFSFEALMKWGRPNFRQYYQSVKQARVLDRHRVKFSFKPGKNQEMPLIMGQLQVLPKHYWQNRDFSRSTLEMPLGSGPYQIETFTAGKTIVYGRVKDYWAADLPINKGSYNFDRIEFEYLRDATVSLEAFKKGAFDFQSVSVKDWNTRLKGPNFDNNLIVKKTMPYANPQGVRGYVFNIRNPLFKDRRVRRALNLAFDFEWINQRFFYGAYGRNRSYFDNSDFAASGLPGEEERTILAAYGPKIPQEVMTEPIAFPRSDGSGRSRVNLREAARLLKEAGWLIRNGQRVHHKTGQPFRFSILFIRKSQAKYIGGFRKNLKRLGIDAVVQVVDTAQYIERIRKFEYDMIFRRIRQSDSPGNEQREYWHSESATIEGSKNYIGIRDPVVDDLINQVIKAPDRENLVAVTRALDRYLLWHTYVIHTWQSDRYRVAYWNKFKQPKIRPLRSFGLYYWWIDSEQEAFIRSHQKRSF